VPSERARKAAEEIWSAWQDGRLLDSLSPEAKPESDTDGRSAQRALSEHAGVQYGWKIAATSKAGQEHIGVDGPIAGRLFERFGHEDGATLAGLSHMAVVEAEIAFRLGADLGGDGVLTEAEVMAAVETVCLAIEVPDSRFARFETVGSAQLLADDACAGRVVIGPEVPGWEGLDLKTQRTAISVDGTRVAEGIGANVLAGPADALTWLANDLLGHGDSLGAGDLVITGTTTVPAAIAPGSVVVAEYEDLGEVRVGFDG
jgi:2-keto-4-pentenoate hydratase